MASQNKIVITGDVVVGPTPYAIRGRVDQMIKSLQEIIDMNPSVVIPGHGEIMQGLTYVKNEQELFVRMEQIITEALKQGMSLREAYNKIAIPKDLEEKFTQNDDVRKWAMNAFFTKWVVRGTYRQNGILK